MSPTWQAKPDMAMETVSFAGWLRVILRGTVGGAVLIAGLALLLLLRLIEGPLFGLRRPWTPTITVVVCRLLLVIIGIRRRVVGVPMVGLGALVANHSSWLDILVLNSRNRVYFVAKSEVAGWPAIGWLARATGTVFIRRRGRDAQLHRDVISQRLQAGHRLLIFPEGTSTDGLVVLPFKSTLFEAFFTANAQGNLCVQPVTVTYQSPGLEAPEYYGWWGGMDLGPHLLKVLSAPRQGEVSLVYHAPLQVVDFADRKALALACEKSVRSGLPPSQAPLPVL